jgi:hypothetical protein
MVEVGIEYEAAKGSRQNRKFSTRRNEGKIRKKPAAGESGFRYNRGHRSGGRGCTEAP